MKSHRPPAAAAGGEKQALQLLLPTTATASQSLRRARARRVFGCESCFAACGAALALFTLLALLSSMLVVDGGLRALGTEQPAAAAALPGGGAANAPRGAAGRAVPAAEAEPAYGAAAGLWLLDVAPLEPPRPGPAAKLRFRANASCLELAKRVEEPYTAAYAPRGAPPQVGAGCGVARGEGAQGRESLFVCMRTRSRA